tara:strand:+ start:1576 stop:2895 length:1320 start_codon:yes stop_codon:yes gene_type:complete
MTTPDRELDIFDLFDPSQEQESPAVEEKDAGWGSWLARKAQRYALRGGEAVAGLPGDVIQGVRGAVQSTAGIDEEEDLNFAQKGARQLMEAFPGSEELRAKSAESFPGAEPQSEFEEVEDEFAGDALTLGLPLGGGKSKIAKKLLRGIGTSAFGNMTKQGIKAMGGSEMAQEGGKMGSILFAGMFGKGRGVKNYIKDTYKKASEFVPPGETFKYPTNKLNKAAKILGTGAMNDAKQEAQSFLDQIKAKSVNGIMSVDDAVQFDKDIGRAIRGAGKDKAKAFNLQQVHDANREALDVYGDSNKAWNDLYKDAKMAYAGIAQSEDMKAFLRKNANLKNLTYGAALLGMEEMKIPGHAALKLGSLGAVASGYFAKEMGKRLVKNPALRKYYQNVLTASISQNKAMLSRNLAGLERVSKKEFEENPMPEDLMSFFEQQSNNEE